jgi:hypothetical protein
MATLQAFFLWLREHPKFTLGAVAVVVGIAIGAILFSK